MRDRKYSATCGHDSGQLKSYVRLTSVLDIKKKPQSSSHSLNLYSSLKMGILMPARTVRGKGTVPCDLSANTVGSLKPEIGPSNLGGAGALLAPPPASALCTHAPRAQSRRRAILPGFECEVERWLQWVVPATVSG